MTPAHIARTLIQTNSIDDDNLNSIRKILPSLHETTKTPRMITWLLKRGLTSSKKI